MPMRLVSSLWLKLFTLSDAAQVWHPVLVSQNP